MRKEIIYAIFAGAVFGIIIAFGVWRANTALDPETKIANIGEQDQIVQVPSNNGFDLALAKPDQRDVITENPTNVSGVTIALTRVTISGEEEDYILESDETGKFEQEVELEGGVNQLIITAFDANGKKVEKNLLVVFSTEFEK